jgi:hypothetical protein
MERFASSNVIGGPGGIPPREMKIPNS